jgi:hypothetical protein
MDEVDMPKVFSEMLELYCWWIAGIRIEQLREISGETAKLLGDVVSNFGVGRPLPSESIVRLEFLEMNGDTDLDRQLIERFQLL